MRLEGLTPRAGRSERPTKKKWNGRSAVPGLAGAESVERWFAMRGWVPWEFQREAWEAYARGESGLVQVSTGAGKTYAAYMGPLAGLIDEMREKGAGGGAVEGLRILYITPLRAVSRDIERALVQPIEELGLRVRVESRTGDTSASVRARQREKLPQVLVTTPESLSLLLTRENAAELFGELRSVIVDEWHELLSSKRGTQVELALARLRRFSPGVRAWGLSATLPNLEEAARGIAGVGSERNRDRGGAGTIDGQVRSELSDASGLNKERASREAVGDRSLTVAVRSESEGDRSLTVAVRLGRTPTIIRGDMPRPVVIDSVLPAEGKRLPWAGHLGLVMLPEVVAALDPDVPTLLFTNTRSQAERWYHAILVARPEWAGVMALHHGSIDRDERERVEAGLKDGSIRMVVATSSLDLGVDFTPVERVFQIGSPKGIARLVQRAGRSSHQPRTACRVTCVPTHVLELVEIEAARSSLAAGKIEAREPLAKPLDVLVQHLVTCAMGGGFGADELYEEVRTAQAFCGLTREEFDWALAMVLHGGKTLSAYPAYHRVAKEGERYVTRDKRLAQLHRLNVGTITADMTVDIRLKSGRSLGRIEESFVAGLFPGQRFVFAGRVVEFVELRDLVAIVRPSKERTTFTPIWGGTRLPISESLAQGIRETLEGAAAGRFGSAEMEQARALVAVQARESVIPRSDETLFEVTRTREGWHLFVFPFDGRAVNAGMAALLAWRLARRQSATFSIAANDYGLEILSPEEFAFEELLAKELVSCEGLAEDIAASMNSSQLARRQFREVARVSGLVQTNYPGTRKSGRQLQASAGLLFDVLSEFDPLNMLLLQARREVLDQHFEQSRFVRALERVGGSSWRIVRTRFATPLSFPLLIERQAARLTTQSVAERMEAMRRAWEAQESSFVSNGRVGGPGASDGVLDPLPPMPPLPGERVEKGTGGRQRDARARRAWQRPRL